MPAATAGRAGAPVRRKPDRPSHVRPWLGPEWAIPVVPAVARQMMRETFLHDFLCVFAPREPLIKSSSRRRGPSNVLSILDSRLRGNDKNLLDQNFPRFYSLRDSAGWAA